MRTSWADSVAADNAASGSSTINGTGGRSAVAGGPYRRFLLLSYGVPTSGLRPGGSKRDHRHQGYSSGDGWNIRGGEWDCGWEQEGNPFGNDDVNDDAERAFDEQESTGINFDAYEDIPVETSGENVPPPVSTFAEIDLGEAYLFRGANM